MEKLWACQSNTPLNPVSAIYKVWILDKLLDLLLSKHPFLKMGKRTSSCLINHCKIIIHRKHLTRGVVQSKLSVN